MPIKQRKTTLEQLNSRFTNNITKNIAKDEVQSKPKAGMSCNGKKQQDNQLMRRWPTSDEKKKEVQDFFHKLGVILIYVSY